MTTYDVLLPFAKTVEQLTGFYTVESDDLDDLLQACGLLTGEGAPVDVRATVDHGGERGCAPEGRGTPGSAAPLTGPEELLRDEWGRLLALLVAQYRRLDLAEDGLADAFEAAARTWPRDGAPANGPAWLLVAARRRILDRLRSESVLARRMPLLEVEASVTRRPPG